MKLSLEGIKDKGKWEAIGIALPGYDAETAAKKSTGGPPDGRTLAIGNIFRIFIGSIADGLLEEGELDTALTCVETFDFDVVDKIYRPFDNLGLSVVLHTDGTRDYKVLGAFGEAVKAQSTDSEQWNRLKEIFASPSLQLVSFTITEKGYALTNPEGKYLPYVQADIDNGPDKAAGAMGIVTAMLLERYKKRRYASCPGVYGQLFQKRQSSAQFCADHDRGMAEKGDMWIRDSPAMWKMKIKSPSPGP